MKVIEKLGTAPKIVAPTVYVGTRNRPSNDPPMPAESWPFGRMRAAPFDPP
jgi:hypothetical protein